MSIQALQDFEETAQRELQCGRVQSTVDNFVLKNYYIKCCVHKFKLNLPIGPRWKTPSRTWAFALREPTSEELAAAID